MVWRGIPEHIRSDNGPEFVAKELRQWLGKVGTGTLYIEPGSPWENGYCDCDQDRDASMCTHMCELPKYQNRWWATSCHKTRSEEGNHTPPPSHNRSKQNEHPEHASLK